MNLIQLVQQVCGEVGINVPSQVVGSTDPAVQQFLYIANRLGRDLARQYDWEQLDKEALVTTVVYTTTGNTTAGSNTISGIPSTAGYTTDFSVGGLGVPPFAQITGVGASSVTINQPCTTTATGVAITVAQTQYALPSDWLRQVAQTEWDRTNRWPLSGPKSSQEWQSFKSGIVYAGPRLRFRFNGGKLQINPIPSQSGTLAYEYISGNWVVAVDNVTTKPAFTADTDNHYYEDSLMVAGIKLQWLKAKGLDYGYAQDEFSRLLDSVKAQDKSAPTLMLSRGYGTVLASMQNIQDGNWPS